MLAMVRLRQGTVRQGRSRQRPRRWRAENRATRAWLLARESCSCWACWRLSRRGQAADLAIAQLVVDQGKQPPHGDFGDVAGLSAIL
jgi:hypothetical protein